MPDPNKEAQILDKVAEGTAAAAAGANAAAAENPAKSVFKSKTFWVNVAAFGAQFLGYLPGPYAMIVPVVNVVLRTITTQPVKVL